MDCLLDEFGALVTLAHNFMLDGSTKDRLVDLHDRMLHEHDDDAYEVYLAASQHIGLAYDHLFAAAMFIGVEVSFWATAQLLSPDVLSIPSPIELTHACRSKVAPALLKVADVGGKFVLQVNEDRTPTGGAIHMILQAKEHLEAFFE